MLEINKIYCGDCLELMKEIPDKSIDLIIADPPYNIGKADWDKIDNYVEWLGERFKECERILKDNGSFYFFHNDFLQIVEIQNWIGENSKFIFKQFIVWNKRFKEASNLGFLNGFIETNLLRNYQKMTEYLLFYTFQDKTGLTTIKLDINNFKILRRYFKELQEWLGVNKKKIINKIGQKADHCFRWGSSQWDMPTIETYQELIDVFKITQWQKYREYEDLRREYEDLRREYEDLRYTFNNQKTHHSVWNYEIENSNHITQKPIKLIENILLHSSNKNDLILDPYLGSGTTAMACKQLKRDFIGIEVNPKYCEIAKKRLKSVMQEMFI